MDAYAPIKEIGGPMWVLSRTFQGLLGFKGLTAMRSRKIPFTVILGGTGRFMVKFAQRHF